MNSSSQKYILFLFLLMTCALSKAQTIEEEVTKKSCECIDLTLKESDIITKEEVNNCIGQSLNAVLKSKTKKEAKKYMRNMTAFAERARIIYKSVSESCLTKKN